MAATSGTGPRATVRKGFLRTLDTTLNRLTRRLALAGRGPFSLIIHVGRKSGREYRTPLILARVPEGFVAELTYGENVDWLRNVEAAGGCTVVYRGTHYRVTGVDHCDARRGRSAFPPSARLLLTALRKQHFRLLRADRATDG
ncbi:MAG TPA: nitroreductase family deazaflavin-dependent oxidoreductase [Actinospica sp.]|jgi:deazaflavin-dependent oxidoreductase (nitroreductase family)|nr:nitroreductase family deazaflavin-dependent oxidoreductase [Actinospica sp.]